MAAEKQTLRDWHKNNHCKVAMDLVVDTACFDTLRPIMTSGIVSGELHADLDAVLHPGREDARQLANPSTSSLG
jgi:hypothetical protein